MSSTSNTSSASKYHMLIAGFLSLAMAGVVGTALAFEHIGGYMPCKLCLEERVPYYIGMPLMLAAAICAAMRGPQKLTRLLLLIGALLMAYGLVLSVYHAGVEWKFWLGPADCATAAVSITTNAGNLLNDMNAIRPAACDQAAGRFLGISFAGWNGVATLGLGLIALYGAMLKPRR